MDPQVVLGLLERAKDFLMEYGKPVFDWVNEWLWYLIHEAPGWFVDAREIAQQLVDLIRGILGL